MRCLMQVDEVFSLLFQCFLSISLRSLGCIGAVFLLVDCGSVLTSVSLLARVFAASCVINTRK